MSILYRIGKFLPSYGKNNSYGGKTILAEINNKHFLLYRKYY